MLHIHHDKYAQKTKAKTDKIRKSFSNCYIEELTEDMVEQYKRSAIRHLLQATHPNSNDKLSRDERANLAEVIEKLSSVHGLEELKATMKSVSTDLIFKKSEKEYLSSEGRESIFLAAAEGAGGGRDWVAGGRAEADLRRQGVGGQADAGGERRAEQLQAAAAEAFRAPHTQFLPACTRLTN